MAVKESVATEEMGTTEQRLRRVTTLFALTLMNGGRDPRTIRRSVLAVAKRVIDELAADDYQAETHTAIVQRTIGTVLTSLGITEEAPCARGTSRAWRDEETASAQT
jgi:hypothetical protein